ncbi:MAG TPA: hypothetical protein VK943_08710 [Arenibaculum sp.]|nr:hypothetical protein [Arenibaculum sp.]
MVQEDDVIERTSIVTYALLQELHRVLADPAKPDEVSLGIVMGLAMFLDDKVGPMRAQRLMSQAPEIILKTDAHVTPELLDQFTTVIRAFGDHLEEFHVTLKPSAADGVI